MNTVRETLATIAKTLGLADLSLNANGQAEIIFGQGFSAYVTRIEETVMELSFRLPSLDNPNRAVLRSMLNANSLGGGTGGGRLALDIETDEVIYCERWNVEDMSEARAEARIQEFSEYGAFWLTEGTKLVIDKAYDTDEDRLDASSIGEHMIRV